MGVSEARGDEAPARPEQTMSHKLPLSINQIAQMDGDTSAKEAARIRARDAAVCRAWRTIAYYEGESACTAAKIAERADLPVAFVSAICERHGHPVSQG